MPITKEEIEEIINAHLECGKATVAGYHSYYVKGIDKAAESLFKRINQSDPEPDHPEARHRSEKAA